jgi:hypothetical protein
VGRVVLLGTAALTCSCQARHYKRQQKIEEIHHKITQFHQTITKIIYKDLLFHPKRIHHRHKSRIHHTTNSASVGAASSGVAAAGTTGAEGGRQALTHGDGGPHGGEGRRDR